MNLLVLPSESNKLVYMRLNVNFSFQAERTFMGDVLLRGHPLTKGRSYVEDRVFRVSQISPQFLVSFEECADSGYVCIYFVLQTDDFFVEFHFVTKCLNEDVERFLNEVRTGRTRAPDILVMNSTHWDVNRQAMVQYAFSHFYKNLF